MTKVDQKVVLKIDWGPAVHFPGEVSLSWQRIVFYTYIFYSIEYVCIESIHIWMKIILS